MKNSRYRIIKRMMDIVVSFAGLVLLSPLLLMIAAIIYFTIGQPVLFSQVRPGLHARAFTLYKFRSMSNARDPEGNLLPDSRRMTRLGRILRSTSLDELPELFNVLKGEMSLVGPRPLLMHYIELFSPEQSRRHEVKPGITGWAQVNGRNAITWEEKFQLDVWYVDNCSLWLDTRILALTVWKVLKREGISRRGEETTREFSGTTPAKPINYP